AAAPPNSSGGAFGRQVELVDRYQGGVDALFHHLPVDDHPADVAAGRDVVHGGEEDLFEDRPQAACARSPLDRLLGDRLERVRGEHQLHAVHLEHAGVLADQGVLRLGENPDQGVLVQVLDRGDDRQTPDELGDQAELDEILGEDLAQQLDGTLLLPGPDLGAEADAPLADPVGDDVLEPGEGAGADEEDVRGVELDELLVGVLAPTLGRYRRHRALEDLEEGLLDALARHVAGDGGVLRLAADLVDLVDVDDALLGPLDVVVGGLQELEEDVLDVFAHVPGFGEGRGVGDGEWEVELAGQGLGEEGLAAAGGADQQDVRLLELDVVPAGLTRPDPLVVVVDGDRQLLLGVFL